MKFPIFKTKIEENGKKFNLTDPKQEREYFQYKAGKEIEKLREFLKRNSFIAYLLGKKNSGKGTYSKMFTKIVFPERIDHLSMGDMVRKVDEELVEEKKRKNLIFFLKRNYRGPSSLEEIIKNLEKRSTKTLLPTELILALVKREIEKREKKALFIDGFPRDLGQIGFSLFFRDLIGYRDDPDIFVLIDVPVKVIETRIKWRRVCPKCNNPRNLRLLVTPEVGYDKEKNEFYLICENCGERMEKKEGDELGVEPIKERLRKEQELMEKALSLYGIPKIFLRNSVPVAVAKDYIDDYEITPEYYFELKNGKVLTKERPWKFLDDEGVESYSLLPQPVVVSLIKQMADVLNL
jgi:adenylate kinase family enzyme